MIGKGLDVEAVRRSVGGLDSEGSLCDVWFDAPLEGFLGIGLNLMIRAIADLRDVVARCDKLKKEAVVGSVAARRRGQAVGGLNQENSEVVVAGLLVDGVVVSGEFGMLNVKDFRSMFVVVAVPCEVFLGSAMLHVRTEVGDGGDDVGVWSRMVLVVMAIVDDLPVEVLLALHFYDSQWGRRRGGGCERRRRMSGSELGEADEWRDATRRDISKSVLVDGMEEVGHKDDDRVVSGRR